MKNKSEKIAQFNELAEKMKSNSVDMVCDEDKEILNEGGKILTELFGDVFSKFETQLDSLSFEPMSESDLYNEIVDNFYVIMRELGIDKFDRFQFAGYDYCREIIVDGREYDLDGEFCHDDLDATEALCAIDCLMADLGVDEETILKIVENMINTQNNG